VREEDDEEEEKESRQRMMTLLVSPRNQRRSMTIAAFSTSEAMSTKERKKTMANPMRAVSTKVDKFALGKKTELLQQQKEDEERVQRALQEQRERDA
jgi:hypothetical protein